MWRAFGERASLCFGGGWLITSCPCKEDVNDSNQGTISSTPLQVVISKYLVFKNLVGLLPGS